MLSKGIILDRGAFVELQDGYKSVIQALGNAFVIIAMNRMFSSRAMTGRVMYQTASGCISMDVNGSISASRFTPLFIEGVPSWDKTDGVVTIHVPDQPPIETRLTEGENRRTLCAIARLVNENGAIKVERINQYFKGQD